MCKGNDKGNEADLDLSLVDKSWGSLPECRVGYAPVSVEKHPSGFILHIREKETGKSLYRYSFDCTGSLEVFIASMTDYLSDWRIRELEKKP